jgi:hypothetical protein
VEQPWYVDDAGVGRKFFKISCFFHKLQEIGPSFEYYLEPSKSILVVPQHNLESNQAAFLDFGFRVTTGNLYLGGFIGKDDALLCAWLYEKTQAWEEAVADLASVTPNFSQAAYSGLQKSLQQEWQFVQRVTKGIGPKFKNIELTLSRTFLQTLFGDDYDKHDPHRKASCLPVKCAGLAIPDPTSLADLNYNVSILL